MQTVINTGLPWTARGKPLVCLSQNTHLLHKVSSTWKGQHRIALTDICYSMGKECLALQTTPISMNWKYLGKHTRPRTLPNYNAFSHYIAEGQRQEFLESLSTSRFYSFLNDGSTDKGNVEDEPRTLWRKKSGHVLGFLFARAQKGWCQLTNWMS